MTNLGIYHLSMGRIIRRLALGRRIVIRSDRGKMRKACYGMDEVCRVWGRGRETKGTEIGALLFMGGDRF